MKMRKSWYAVLFACVAVLLSGCGNRIPDMTEEQLQAVGEYMAQQLLFHDANNQSRLVDVEIPEEEAGEQSEEEIPEEKTEPENVGMDPTEDTPVVNLAEGQENAEQSAVSLEEALGLQDPLALFYRGFEILDNYPADTSTEEYFSVDAEEGNKLLVLHFELQNRGEGTETADTLNQRLLIKVSVNGISTGSLTSFLENDLSIYRESLNPGENRDVVILAEYETQALQDVASVEINVKNGDINASIRLE